MSKVYLVTGSARGLGWDVTSAALAAGHQVVATARRPDQLAGLVEQHGARILPIGLDVTDYPGAQAAVQAAVDRFGRLDVLVNNAGYANLAAVEDITIEDFRAQVDTNLFGVVNLTKAALPVMRAQGVGYVIQVSSVGGRLSTPGLSAYQAAKWAVGGFSEVLAQEVAGLGIKVTILEPGGLRTDWAGSSMAIPPISAPYQAIVGAVASRMGGHGNEAGDPAKVAQVILHLADLAEPPLRLLLGTDAFTYANAAGRARAAADEAWRTLSVSTDHDDANPAQRDPLGQSASS